MKPERIEELRSKVADAMDKNRAALADSTRMITFNPATVEELLDVVVALRATHVRLNRRCQDYERALAERLDKARGPSLGRALANGAASLYSSHFEKLREECALLVAHWRAQSAEFPAWAAAAQDLSNVLHLYGTIRTLRGDPRLRRIDVDCANCYPPSEEP